MTSSGYDVAVIGAGPGGLAAAVSAAENGARVVLVDESPQPGGQIWREDLGTPAQDARPWLRRLEQARIDVMSGTSVWQAETAGLLSTSAGRVTASKIILASGARERLLPFPGWTRTGVVGAGGIQALLHAGLEVKDRRVVIAGSGPLLLQVASNLTRHGARVLRIAEQAPLSRLLGFASALGVSKTVQALGLANPRLRTSSWPLEALGSERLEAVKLQIGKDTETHYCDYLAVGFGLTANLELPRALGCDISDGAVTVDDRQQSSISNVYAVGELCGIKGAKGALADGICAGHAVCGMAPPARISRARNRERRFQARLADAFSIRDEVRNLADADTMICRCESVPKSAVAAWSDWHSAKLHTRCGMGLCQGRICGSVTETLFDWGPTSVRPPLSPIPIAAILSDSDKGPEP
ncbi:MAG: FAD-dependent oxidoreductase [Alphaproteobacteria bacterium]